VQVWIPFYPPAQAVERAQPPGATYN
jgi:hypothetical protein